MLIKALVLVITLKSSINYLLIKDQGSNHSINHFHHSYAQLKVRPDLSIPVSGNYLNFKFSLILDKPYKSPAIVSLLSSST